MKNLLLTLVMICCVGGVFGCDDKKAPKDENQKITIVMPDGKEEVTSFSNITPARADYSYNGQTYKKDVAGFDWFVLPFGDNIFTVLGKQETNKIGASSTPKMVIDSTGIHADEATTEKSQIGGERSTSIIDWIKKTFADFGNTLIIVGIALAALFIIPMIFPAAAPICAAIWNGIKKFISWLIPLFGGLSEFLQNLFSKKALMQQTDGDAQFEEAIKNDDRLEESVKEYVLELFTTAHKQAQDKNVQDHIMGLKAMLKK